MDQKFEKCPTCGDYDLFPKHRCRDQWRLVGVDGDSIEDERIIFGNDAEDAAVRWFVRNHSSYDYPESLVVRVRDLEETSEWEFDLTAELVPEYNAKEVSHKVLAIADETEAP